MNEPRARAWVAGVIAATLLLPAVASSAGPKEEKLEKIEAEREALQDQIDLDEATLADLRANAKDLNGQIVKLREEVADLDTQIAEISSEVRSIQARIDALQAEIDQVKEMATSQAVALYKAGSGEPLEALLDSDSLSELDNKLELMGVAAQENTQALVSYGRLRLTIEAENRELFAAKEALVATRNEQAEALADLDARHEELQANLLALDERLGRRRAAEGILARQEARLEEDILAAQAGRAVAARGISTQGFIWPLNGPITSYYGPRWGRMHNGLDIDGVTGDPIVASKEGRVIIASYYGGYGYAVAIDHGGGVSTLYAHQSKLAVSEGETVSQGQVIGYVGNTGNSYGDHLHFEVKVNGSSVDPLDYLP